MSVTQLRQIIDQEELNVNKNLGGRSIYGKPRSKAHMIADIRRERKRPKKKPAAVSRKPASSEPVRRPAGSTASQGIQRRPASSIQLETMGSARRGKLQLRRWPNGGARPMQFSRFPGDVMTALFDCCHINDVHLFGQLSRDARDMSDQCLWDRLEQFSYSRDFLTKKTTSTGRRLQLSAQESAYRLLQFFGSPRVPKALTILDLRGAPDQALESEGILQMLRDLPNLKRVVVSDETWTSHHLRRRFSEALSKKVIFSR